MPAQRRKLCAYMSGAYLQLFIIATSMRSCRAFCCVSNFWNR